MPFFIENPHLRLLIPNQPHLNIQAPVHILSYIGSIVPCLLVPDQEYGKDPYCDVNHSASLLLRDDCPLSSQYISPLIMLLLNWADWGLFLFLVHLRWSTSENRAISLKESASRPNSFTSWFFDAMASLTMGQAVSNTAFALFFLPQSSVSVNGLILSQNHLLQVYCYSFFPFVFSTFSYSPMLFFRHFLPGVLFQAGVAQLIQLYASVRQNRFGQKRFVLFGYLRFVLLSNKHNG